MIYSRLRITEPGAGYFHFPLERDREYFMQLTAEKQVIRFSKGVAKREWIKTRSRNEVLDCTVYALAAFKLLNPDLVQLAENMEKAPQIEQETPNNEEKKQKEAWIPRMDDWMKAVDYVTINLPIVLSDQEAKVVADVTLYNAWVGRVSYTFTVPPKYALLEPSDVITITKDGAAYLLRVTSSKLVRNGMQEITAVAEDVSSYDFYNPAGTGTSNIQLPPTISASRLELMDLPAFPTDGVTDAYLRYGVVGLGDNWAGSAVYRSDDGGSNYALMQTLTAQAIIGAVLNIIPAGTVYGWDNISTIDVLLTFGQLQSVTDIAVLNGANVCVIGDEVIQFQTATLLDTNKYRLSGLLRGRLGTEWAAGSHVAGERFVMLTNALARELMASSGWGISKKFKPVTIGSTLGATDPQDFAYTARALKPYSPVHILGARSAGDLAIDWKRRTRIGGDWRDAVDIPLSEESERYEVDIMQGMTVKRTITGLTSPAATYTAAQQVADFGATQSSILVNVYQISAAVGRGYAGIATL